MGNVSDSFCSIYFGLFSQSKSAEEPLFILRFWSIAAGSNNLNWYNYVEQHDNILYFLLDHFQSKLTKQMVKNISQKYLIVTLRNLPNGKEDSCMLH